MQPFYHVERQYSSIRYFGLYEKEPLVLHDEAHGLNYDWSDGEENAHP